MEKTHVLPGSSWTEEEENAVYDGYTSRNSVEEILARFPTDRNPDSIRLKVGNHIWEDTNGRRGLRGGNKWVKQKWVAHRMNTVLYNTEQIKSLRSRESDLTSQLTYVRNRIVSHETRLREVLTLPN